MKGWLFMLISLVSLVAEAQSAWPGETWQNSTNLTSIDPFFSANLSGSYWNEQTQRLWVCVNNPGTVFCLRKKDGANNWLIDSISGVPCRYSIGGDVESVCHANEGDSTFYVAEEASSSIKRYKVSSNGQFQLLRTFDTSPFMPSYVNGLGPEGLAFVPDFWLIRNGFVKSNGQLYAGGSAMGGLFFVAHQNGGHIYAFDFLPSTGGVVFIGDYKTARTESSGLEFDRSTGHLFIWHNIGVNYIEVTDLRSSVSGTGRQIRKQVEFNGPKSGNLEGIAFTPACSNQNWYFATDDANANGDALMWFRQFKPCVPLLSFDVSDTALCVDDTVRFMNTSCGDCPSALYSWNFGQNAQPQTAIGRGPHKVIYSEPGLKTVSLFFQGGIKDTLIRNSVLHVIKEPKPSITLSDSTPCAGDTIVATSSTAVHYYWSSGDTTTSIVITNNQPLRVQTEGQTGCRAVSDSLAVLFRPLPVVLASMADTILFENDLPLSLHGLPTGGSWLGTGITGGLFYPTESGLGVFELEYVFTDSVGCRNSDRVTVQVTLCINVNKRTLRMASRFRYDPVLQELVTRETTGGWILTDLTGRTQNHHLRQIGPDRFDASLLPSGLYVAKEKTEAAGWLVLVWR
jgi:PKD repeat protein